MKKEEVKTYIEALDAYVTKEGWKGYDPYDIMNSTWPLQKMGKYPLAILTQIQKRNPFNWRPLLGIKKEHNPKGMGLFLQSYSKLYALTGEQEYLDKAEHCYQWLLENQSTGFERASWGYNFGWANPGKVVPRYSPNIVVTGFICKGMFEYYRAFPERKDIPLIEKVAAFILKHLEQTQDESGICFSYTTLERDICYNASLQAAEVFAWLYRETEEERYRSLADQTCSFVTQRQNEDGSWDYSERIDGKGSRVQLDFHQGYILDSLLFVQEQLDMKTYQSSIDLGYRYYHEHLVHKDGSTPYRFPEQSPIDIHNQAQAIITSIQFGDLQQAAICLRWTFEHMGSKKGHFYYKKYPWITLKTPYIRWSQAWMMMAMTEFYSFLQKEADVK